MESSTQSVQQGVTPAVDWADYMARLHPASVEAKSGLAQSPITRHAQRMYLMSHRPEASVNQIISQRTSQHLDQSGRYTQAW